MIRAQGEGRSRTSNTAGECSPAPEAVAALRAADTILLGPSNPVLSIDPILSVLQDELHSASAPVVAVSPLVRGRVLKGPTAECLRWAGPDARLRTGSSITTRA